MPLSCFLPRSFVGLALALAVVTAVAAPPPWAPAHGYRAKQSQPAGVVSAELPADIGAGRCNRSAVGAVLGGVAGGALGAQMGEGDGKVVATIGGTLVGMLVGRAIGRSMDAADHACVQRSLEHAEDNQQVAWRDPDTGRDYAVTPTGSYRDGAERLCRDYVMHTTMGGADEEVRGTACRQADGSWLMVD